MDPISNRTHTQLNPHTSKNNWLAIRILHQTARRICLLILARYKVTYTVYTNNFFSPFCHFRPTTQPNRIYGQLWDEERTCYSVLLAKCQHNAPMSLATSRPLRRQLQITMPTRRSAHLPSFLLVIG